MIKCSAVGLMICLDDRQELHQDTFAMGMCASAALITFMVRSDAMFSPLVLSGEIDVTRTVVLYGLKSLSNFTFADHESYDGIKHGTGTKEKM